MYDEALTYEAEVEKLETAMDAIRAIRNIRAEAEAAPSKKLRAFIYADEDMDKVKSAERYISAMANITEITFTKDKAVLPEDVMSAVIAGDEIYIPTDDLLDYRAEFERLSKEKKRLEGEVKRVVGKLSNEGFVSKAPEKVIEAEREKKIMYEDMLAKVTERLESVEKKL